MLKSIGLPLVITAAGDPIFLGTPPVVPGTYGASFKTYYKGAEKKGLYIYAGIRKE